MSALRAVEGERVVRRLKRDIRFMERLIAELPDYLDDLPPEARAEVVARIGRLPDRITAFTDAMTPATPTSYDPGRTPKAGERA